MRELTPTETNFVSGGFTGAEIGMLAGGAIAGAVVAKFASAYLGSGMSVVVALAGAALGSMGGTEVAIVGAIVGYILTITLARPGIIAGGALGGAALMYQIFF
jgi:hypothetical protein